MKIDKDEWLCIAMIVMILLAAATQLFGYETVTTEEYFGQTFFNRELQGAYYNGSGSCVYMSTAAAGIAQDEPIAWTLPWTTDYGPACRGGSTPSRFEADARERGMKALNVTGSQTYDYMRWGIRQGKWVAIGAGTQHFQTLVGYNDQGTETESDDTWDVWNCNVHGEIRRYSNREFQWLHESSGRWCIILDYPDRPGIPTRKAK